MENSSSDKNFYDGFSDYTDMNKRKTFRNNKRFGKKFDKRIIIAISALVILVIILVIVNSLNNDNVYYNEARIKIDEYFSLYNSFKSVKNSKIEDEKKYGPYLDLVKIEYKYLYDSQIKDTLISEKLKELINTEIYNYNKGEVERFKKTVSDLKSLVNKEIEDSKTRSATLIKEIEALDINEKNKESYLKLVQERIKIENNEYLDNYHKLFKDLIKNYEGMSKILNTISDKKDNIEYKMNEDIIKIERIQKSIDEIFNEIVKISISYDNSVKEHYKDKN